MSLIDMMSAMQNQRLLDNGEYMVITVDMMIYTPKEALKYLWSKFFFILNQHFLKLLLIIIVCLTEPDHLTGLRHCMEPKDFVKKARSLMVIVSTPPVRNYEDFMQKVREYSNIEPFNFRVPDLLQKFEKVSLF